MGGTSVQARCWVLREQAPVWWVRACGDARVGGVFVCGWACWVGCVFALVVPYMVAPAAVGGGGGVVGVVV